MNPVDLLWRRVALRKGTDAEGTVRRVASGASLTPENLWLLGSSAILTSIGLDIGSAAVIIGAMLISPLMGPILGVGLAIGITDRELLLRSLRELGLATLLSLAVSAVYFFVSPLATPTAELIARTRPTLLDVGVAFFGGIAGIVAGSRKEQSMALPGVAIATALMPPLCTAGFGLATGTWAFLFGAFYLFVLNAVFIALSTFLVVRFLRFPHHEEIAPEARRRERRLVAGVAILASLPSVYFLYDAVQGVREKSRVAAFVHAEVEAPGRAAPQWERRHEKQGEVLKVYVAGHPVDPAGVDSLQVALPKYGLAGLRLELVQSDISAEDLQRFQGEVQRDILRAVSSTIGARDSATQLQLRQDSLRYAVAAREVASAFPEIAGMAFSPRLDLLATDSVASPPVFFLRFGPGVSRAQRASILTRTQALLRHRLNSERLVALER